MSNAWKELCDEVEKNGYAEASPLARLVWECDRGNIDQHASQDLMEIAYEQELAQEKSALDADAIRLQAKEIEELTAALKIYADPANWVQAESEDGKIVNVFLAKCENGYDAARDALVGRLPCLVKFHSSNRHS